MDECQRFQDHNEHSYKRQQHLMQYHELSLQKMLRRQQIQQLSILGTYSRNN